MRIVVKYFRRLMERIALMYCTSDATTPNPGNTYFAILDVKLKSLPMNYRNELASYRLCLRPISHPPGIYIQPKTIDQKTSITQPTHPIHPIHRTQTAKPPSCARTDRILQSQLFIQLLIRTPLPGIATLR